MKEKFLVYKLSETIKNTSKIESQLFEQFNVKRGLRNADHTGVLVGLTKIGDVLGYERLEDGSLKPIAGKLLYRGIDIEELVHNAQQERRTGFEETIYLLLSGYLPDKEELRDFSRLLCESMALEKQTKIAIMELEGHDVMNILARTVLEMYTYDPEPDDTSRDNLMRQSIDLIAKFPAIIAYAYNMLSHSAKGKSLHIRHPHEDFSIAENFLYMMKGSGRYTELDVRVLDLAMIIHAEHGGGNNSTFTVRVTSSTGTDTYSSIAAGIGSLKGPLHGGANLQVGKMLKHLVEEIKNWTDANEIDAYLQRILNKEVFDRKGLIYGIGHAVYTVSDPRAMLLKEMAHKLAQEKGREKEFNFLNLLEERAIHAIVNRKNARTKKQVCANVDFYSGFVYDMIGLPKEVYTPLFAMSRIVGWCAHRIEELNFDDRRIIRPAYKNIGELMPFIPLKDR
ncbi:MULTISPECIES: citrate/2-methylcitrate synthase [unclassified Gilliamella]|uniref:citrate/2-methylcitrate synthase n=1 Tax=unclassified Gilliamella TaxID=2685620 RepID=UPI00226A8B78|nr:MULTISPECIES: citrate/2-methylcitrate synthase [unclassified Gilliamella]MCX8597715.1 citrate/2-methylcitrate synthase [Gilliamella sp. B3493]MCX8599862.1 citrate/2-methylcitrate synthase [Gilliamella sp. B3486]MCX8690220.1 citrate/2-methylcitrate synthase [Gilliamella sp. B2973]MCX8705851.1 citrate/2-methylcitrate synthase [Gilliamella sp. B3127]